MSKFAVDNATLVQLFPAAANLNLDQRVAMCMMMEAVGRSSGLAAAMNAARGFLRSTLTQDLPGDLLPLADAVVAAAREEGTLGHAFYATELVALTEYAVDPMDPRAVY